MELKKLLEEKNRLEILKSRNELTKDGLEILAELTQVMKLQQVDIDELNLFKQVFAAAGYEFIQEEPSGRLLFWHGETERDVQFWHDNKTTLTKVMEFICERAYESGVQHGKIAVRAEIKNALDI